MACRGVAARYGKIVQSYPAGLYLRTDHLYADTPAKKMCASHRWAPSMLIRSWRSTNSASTRATPPSTAASTWEAFDAAKLAEHRLVAFDDGGRVLSWAAVVPVSDRCAYAGVVEYSVYVPRCPGPRRGPGAADRAAGLHPSWGIWTAQSGIFPENAASLALHTQAGFRVIGIRERIGRHCGKWRDILLVERRSPNVS